MNKPLKLTDELLPFPVLTISDYEGIRRQSQLLNLTCICDSHNVVLAMFRDYSLAVKVKEILDKQ